MVVWDTGGMERFGCDSLSQSYFSKSRGVILVYDTGNKDTLEDLNNWIRLIRERCNKDIILCLCGHNTNSVENPVDENSVKSFYTKHRIPPSLVFTVDPSTGDNMVEFFRRTVEAVHLTATQPRQARDELYGNLSLQDMDPTSGATCCSKCGY